MPQCFDRQEVLPGKLDLISTSASSYSNKKGTCIFRAMGSLESYCQKGGFENLKLIREAGVKCPLLCKEFVVDAYQMFAARA